MIKLDDRLQLAADMYQPCALGADIGTDHGMLPCYLLETGVCERMILADVSAKALAHARALVAEKKLEKAAELVCANGLFALKEPCGCISCTGMGGDTMAQILTEGKEKIHNAVLVLSCHTEPHRVRRALMELGYHIVREELAKAAGRVYLVWRAEPGAAEMTEEEIMFGTAMLDKSPLAAEYFSIRLEAMEKHGRGMEGSGRTETEEYVRLCGWMDILKRRINGS